MKRPRILAIVLAAVLALTPALASAQPQSTSIAEPIVRTADDQAASDIDLQATYTTLNIPGTDLYDEAFEVLDIVNQHRTAEGLRPLTMDAELLAVAMQRAAETVVSYSHTRPNGTVCFTASSKMFGENIATGQWTAAEVMDDWMHSTGHRENIMNSSYASIGVGCFQAQDGALYWVQCFSPSAGTAATQPANIDVAHPVEVYTGHINPQIAVGIPGVEQTDDTAFMPRGSRNPIILQGINAGEQGWNPSYFINADSFTWTSSDEGIMTVEPDGTLIALAPGDVTITGVSGGLQIDIFLTVTDESPFSDVDETQWYAEAVNFASSNGLITGYSGSDRFGIGDDMTRAQLVTVLFRIAEPNGADPNAVNTTGMSDVKNGEWYTSAANWAVENGVVNGFIQADGSALFKPDDPISREQLVTILANFTHADTAAADDSAFNALPDHSATSNWATPAVTWAVDEGIINGKDNGGTRVLAPGDVVTREQAAAILMNSYNLGVLP
ncbi:S-layer homology domain-containing protein [Collinsella tanakaei]|nr:S-layer homology domain-containing protein [Collinsella tanakaei]